MLAATRKRTAKRMMYLVYFIFRAFGFSVFERVVVFEVFFGIFLLLPFGLVAAFEGVLRGVGRAGGVFVFSDEVEVDRTALEVEGFDEIGFEVAAVLLGEFVVVVAEDFYAEGAVAGLRGVVGAEAFAGYGGRRRLVG